MKTQAIDQRFPMSLTRPVDAGCDLRSLLSGRFPTPHLRSIDPPQSSAYLGAQSNTKALGTCLTPWRSRSSVLSTRVNLSSEATEDVRRLRRGVTVPDAYLRESGIEKLPNSILMRGSRDNDATREEISI